MRRPYFSAKSLQGRRILLALTSVVLLLSVAAWLLLTFGLQPASFPAGSESAARLIPGDLAVIRTDIDLVDRQRTTPPNRDYAGAASRELKGAVWFPGTGGPYPLIVHSHGFTSSYRNGAYLARHLAGHGYVVAAVHHPLTHAFAPGGPNVRDVVNQPGDVSFLIDMLTRAPGTVDMALEGRIDGERIAVMGISLGALTATLTGFHPQLLDERVDAVLSIAGPTVFLTQAFFSRPSLPFLMLAGDADALVPWTVNARPVPDKIRGGQLLTLAAGSHTGFAGGTALLRWMRNPDALGCWSVQRNLDLDDDPDWSALLGGAQAGVDDGAELDMCSAESLPEAMHVLRQQMISRVAVRAFFDSVLPADPAVRRQAGRYLHETLAQELPDVSYGSD